MLIFNFALYVQIRKYTIDTITTKFSYNQLFIVFAIFIQLFSYGLGVYWARELEKTSKIMELMEDADDLHDSNEVDPDNFN